MIAWLINSCILLLCAAIIPGIHISSLWAALGAVFLIGLINTIVKPIFILLTLPITIVTLGLFLFAINSIMFYFAGQIIDGFKVDGAMAAIFGSILYSVLRGLFETRSAV